MTNSSATFRYCPYCGAELPTPVASRGQTCVKCKRTIESNQSSGGREYRSKLSLFGWPLIHIHYGRDPATKRPSIARGFIAMGDVAIGGFAMGGVAIGGMAFGGIAIGLITFAGISIGLLLAIGGMAIGAGLSLGGMAVGSIAVGGMALGYFSMGGMALGPNPFGGNFRDQNALQFFSTWKTQIKLLVGQFGPMIAFAILAPLISIPFLRRSDDTMQGLLNKQDAMVRQPSWLGLLICWILGGAFGIGLLWLVMVIVVTFI